MSESKFVPFFSAIQFEQYLAFASPLGNTMEYTPETPAFDVDAYRASGAEFDLNQLYMSLINYVSNPLSYRHMCYNTLRYGCRYDPRAEYIIMRHACPRLQFALNFRISARYQKPLIRSMPTAMPTGTTYKAESAKVSRQHDQRKLKRCKARPEVRGVYDSSKKTKIASVSQGGAVPVRTARGYIRPHSAYSWRQRPGDGSY